MTTTRERQPALQSLMDVARQRRVDYFRLYRVGIMSGELEATKIRGRWFVSDEAITAFLKQHPDLKNAG